LHNGRLDLLPLIAAATSLPATADPSRMEFYVELTYDIIDLIGFSVSGAVDYRKICIV
jgi:hypothetical protein